jgi:hypothetical protein
MDLCRWLRGFQKHTLGAPERRVRVFGSIANGG